MRHWLTAVAIAALLLALPRLALAQTVTLQSPGITRVNADGSMVTTKSTTNKNVFARVNGVDCYGGDDKGIEYAFPITVSNETMPAAHHIEVWAGGSDCTPLTARSGTTAACWPVSQATFPPNSVVQTVRIRAQDIVSQITSTTKTLTYTAADKNACTLSTALSTVTVYFILLDGTSNPVGTAAAWPMTVKLVGPAAPNPVSADGLDTAVSVHWTASKDTEISGYRVYVYTGTAVDASTMSSDASGTLVTTCADGGDPDEAGNIPDGGCTSVIVYDASGGGGGTCSSTTLQSGGRADQLTASAQSGKTDTNKIVTGLTNGGSYAAAVACTDGYDNVGPLSDVVCVTPAPVLDFWNTYRSNGGTAGGFCALEGPGAPAGGAAMGLGLAFAAVAWARRRGRK